LLPVRLLRILCGRYVVRPNCVALLVLKASVPFPIRSSSRELILICSGPLLTVVYHVLCIHLYVCICCTLVVFVPWSSAIESRKLLKKLTSSLGDWWAWRQPCDDRGLSGGSCHEPDVIATSQQQRIDSDL
jgi:hypothetical protein